MWINRRAMLLGVATLPLFGAAACSAGGERFPDYRYRLTVEVDTPEGVRSGASVIEVKTGQSGAYNIPSPNTLFFRASGEAVAVDLPNGQTLFALLRSETSVNWVYGVMAEIIPKSEVKPQIVGSAEEDDPYVRRFETMLTRTGVYDVPRQFPDPPPYIDETDKPVDYPMLVTFKDIADPKTVEKVDPDNFVATFGKGYALRRITVQLTDAPVTNGIQRRFSWWEKYRDLHFDDTPTIINDLTNPSLAAHLSSGTFSTEFAK